MKKILVMVMVLLAVSFGFAQRSSSVSVRSSTPTVTRTYTAPTVKTTPTVKATPASVVPRATTAPSTSRNTSSTLTQPNRVTNFVPKITPSQPLPKAVYQKAPLYKGKYHTHNYYHSYRSNNAFANYFPWLYYWDAEDLDEDDEYAPMVATETGGLRPGGVVKFSLMVIFGIMVIAILVRILRR